MNHAVGPVIHVAIETSRGRAALRDLVAEDIDHIVAYLHDERDEHLNSLIDRKRLGTPEDTRRRFFTAVRTGRADQRHIAFAITVDGQFAGFTSLVRHAPQDNYSHWHVSDRRLRAGGLSTTLYPRRIQLYFDLFPIDRLIHQTKTRNIGVNRMLDKYVPVAETRYIEWPDGAASADEFHLRYVFRDDIPRLLAIAGGLSRHRGGDGE
jgi:RimJ/RimL family protein N-acetyltransferase